MANATTSGALTGAASGAALGFTTFGVYGAVVGGIIGGIGGLISGSSTDAQFDNQTAWAQYNAQMGYQTALSNNAANLVLARINAASITKTAGISATAQLEAAEYNASLIAATTAYNTQLIEQEIPLLWEAADLDIKHIERQRSEERGQMVATMGASGTDINEGTNVDLVADQMTQEMMDILVVRHGADIQVGKIQDVAAQNDWQGELAVQHTLWQGEMGSYVTMANARNQAAGIAGSAAIQGMAALQSAGQRRSASLTGISQTQSQFSAQNTQNMVSGLFSAAGQAAGTAVGNAQPTSLLGSTMRANSGQGGYTVNYQAPQSSSLLEAVA